MDRRTLLAIMTTAAGVCFVAPVYYVAFKAVGAIVEREFAPPAPGSVHPVMAAYLCLMLLGLPAVAFVFATLNVRRARDHN